MKVWLTNNLVAWEIPDGLIAECYRRGLYMPPDLWKVSVGRLPESVRMFGKRHRKRTTPDRHSLL